ncbi:MAG: alkaline phosphatase D family protein [Burkholderiales bacterium]|nr:alkaline phosphatase D family protein [Burkholderiales bacterium]
MVSRRAFLQHATRLGTLAALAHAFPGFAAERSSAYPFTLGVASGSPKPNSVVIWTRLLPDVLNAGALPAVPYKVRWEVAQDAGFRQIVTHGFCMALPELAHSVHVDVIGLQPDRWYWYRFMLGDAVSAVARTRTAPALDAMPEELKLAVASCQHWEYGEYAAHRHIADANPDLVAFLGDYIYERGPYDLKHPVKPRLHEFESYTLADYRRRYAQYKSDAHLQAAHHVAPWILTWDDHEVSNDYANDQDERLDVNFLERRAAAYQAFYEHMPVRLFPSGEATPFAHMRIYERYDWGRLARFHVLDDRQYRSHQACPKPGRGGSRSVTDAECHERQDTTRTMLGQAQEKWLARGLANSVARWNVLTQQTFMAQASQTPLVQAAEARFWTDGWDGYPAARQRLFDDLQKSRAANPLVISGDVHTFYAADLQRNFYQPASPNNPVLATEFCGTSVTSTSRPQERTDRYVALNPHIKYGRSDQRGLMLMRLSPTLTETQFLALDDVSRADSGIRTLCRFVVEDGHPGVQLA